jgi:hypothetical protein
LPARSREACFFGTHWPVQRGTDPKTLARSRLVSAFRAQISKKASDSCADSSDRCASEPFCGALCGQGAPNSSAPRLNNPCCVAWRRGYARCARVRC